MNKVAVDTNVIIQSYDSTAPAQQTVALHVLAQRPVVSAQVVSEFLNVLQRRLHLPKLEALTTALQVLDQCEIWPVTHATLADAARLVNRYDFQLFDALIVAAALEAGCTTLYSADFQHQQLIDGRLRLLNPFRR